MGFGIKAIHSSRKQIKTAEISDNQINLLGLDCKRNNSVYLFLQFNNRCIIVTHGIDIYIISFSLSEILLLNLKLLLGNLEINSYVSVQ